MMRELKFRAWDIKRKRYINDLTVIKILPLALDKEIAEGLIEIEQYTGLKDKNGKEIYEGDILGDMWGGGYIAWCDKCKQIQYHISTHECMACLGDVQWYELVNDNGKLEVIGNIHENPELLEEEC